MSTYLQFCSNKSREYYELTSGSWYTYMEDLFDALTYCKQNKKSFKDFIKKLRKAKVFDGFFDSGEDYINEETEKYFLRPLYDWAFDKDDIRLIDDEQLYEQAARALCKDKGVAPPDRLGWVWPKEIENLIEKEGGYVVDKYYKCVGKMFYDKEELNKVGVSFARVLPELKAGANIFRKSNPTTVWWIENNELHWSWDYVDECPCFCAEEVLSDDWEYHYAEEVL